MNILNQSGFSTRLLFSFVICALITLAVGGLGMVGTAFDHYNKKYPHTRFSACGAQ